MSLWHTGSLTLITRNGKSKCKHFVTVNLRRTEWFRIGPGAFYGMEHATYQTRLELIKMKINGQ